MIIAAISGSLRAGSSNGALLRAAARLAPEGVRVLVEEDLGKIPHFNPDLDFEGAQPPAPVAAFRAFLSGADAVLICTPEYAHGVPGSLKNALDWIVSSGELRGKAVGLILASPGGGEWARASLAATLEVMEARVLPDASISVRHARKAVDDEGNILDEALAEKLRSVLIRLAEATQNHSERSEVP